MESRVRGKPSCTVWSGGKSGDNIKGLPITISRDEEMLALINSTLEKLWCLTEEAFLELDLELYKEEPMEDE